MGQHFRNGCGLFFPLVEIETIDAGDGAPPVHVRCETARATRIWMRVLNYETEDVARNVFDSLEIVIEIWMVVV